MALTATDEAAPIKMYVLLIWPCDAAKVQRAHLDLRLAAGEKEAGPRSPRGSRSSQRRPLKKPQSTRAGCSSGAGVKEVRHRHLQPQNPNISASKTEAVWRWEGLKSVWKSGRPFLAPGPSARVQAAGSPVAWLLLLHRGLRGEHAPSPGCPRRRGRLRVDRRGGRVSAPSG